MTTATIQIAPENPVCLDVFIPKFDPTTGKVVDLTTGAVVGFITVVAANAQLSPAAVAEDPSLSAALVHVSKDLWTLAIPASAMTVALWNTINAAKPAGTPWIIIRLPNGLRYAFPATYQDNLIGVVE